MVKQINLDFYKKNKSFYEETKDILEMLADDMGLVMDFKYVQNVEELMQNIRNEQKGFKLYDIYFIFKNCKNFINLIINSK